MLKYLYAGGAGICLALMVVLTSIALSRTPANHELKQVVPLPSPGVPGEGVWARTSICNQDELLDCLRRGFKIERERVTGTRETYIVNSKSWLILDRKTGDSADLIEVSVQSALDTDREMAVGTSLFAEICLYLFPEGHEAADTLGWASKALASGHDKGVERLTTRRGLRIALRHKPATDSISLDFTLLPELASRDL